MMYGIQSLQSGLTKTKLAATRQKKKTDGTICKTAEENAAVL